MERKRTTVASDRGQHAVATVEQVFAQAGWKVRREPNRGLSHSPDLVVRHENTGYIIEVKAAAEGRRDRLVPLWSQALLQATRGATGRERPLAIVAAPKISPRTAEQILQFAAEYAPDAAVGVIDFAGLRRFRGVGLTALNADHREFPSSPTVSSGGTNLFSDLNQWMLKVLLAPELPEQLLTAPRQHYRNASELALAAQVSVMSAFRLVQQLTSDGYLHESTKRLELVRREELFQRWGAAPRRRVHELRVRLLGRRDLKDVLVNILEQQDACLALFAAADALKLGFVRGVPPYVYVRQLEAYPGPKQKFVVPAEPGEPPDLILRQAPVPHSIFRATVNAGGLPACDIIQVWLDVLPHPTRGQEQADLIWNRVLASLVRRKPARG